MDKIALNDGQKIPPIGYGPGILSYDYSGFLLKSRSFPAKVICHLFQKKLIQSAKESIEDSFISSIAYAMQTGFELIDYSAAYGDGSFIGKAIKLSGISRKKLCLTARVSNHAQFSGSVRQEFLKTLHNYQTDYVDILMFHWPVPGCFLQTWKEMRLLQKEGLVKSLAVANCHEHHINQLSETGQLPVINQIEVHPLFSQEKLRAFCKRNKIVVQAYTPIARNDDRLIRLPKLKEIAQRHKKTCAQIILRWHIQKGLVPVIKSLSKEHINANLQVFDFSLSQVEINTIDSFNINSRLRYDPDNCDFSIL